MNDRQGAIEVKHVDGEAHSQSMNAMAGNNPESGTITEVTRAESKQAAKPGPVSIGHRHRCGEIGLAGVIKGLTLRGKKRHNPECSPIACCRLLCSYFGIETGPSCRISSIIAGPMVTKIIEGRTNITSGGTILMVVFAACSSARCRRSVRRESECTRRA